MTSSDSGSPSRNQGNPFDTGLPMVRPEAATPKRRRRVNPRRGSGQRRTPTVDVPDQPAPPRRAAPSGDWQEWLEPRRPVEPPPEAQARTPTRAAETESGPLDETSSVVPTIIDRSGGNPGPALRHPARRRESQQSNGGNRVVAVLIVLGVVLAVVSVVMFVFGGSGEQKRPAAATTPAATPGTAGRTPGTTAPGDQPSAVATPGCEQRRTGDVISGTDPGGTSDGPSAILAFERAYYVQRSGFAARGVVANDANVPAADQIQRGINQVPVGTLYCVQITRAGSDVGEAHWEVRLTQQRPGEQPQTFTQIVTTRTAGNRTLITAINAA
ncbi:hypothetical protein OG874_20755 [Nocardia sp. NBC_00565]|uniref:hypothetical protein n=1 Tax=Nocardia sp. NBC_00565 TaxID=2975993 RepID=UPI002E80869E|nr:hypothetical protein [Nocardia sp. NBC_00565]WUC07367.1 hypothetical protein OG874_20755 [Nocardia sp. NBC_00565]